MLPTIVYPSLVRSRLKKRETGLVLPGLVFVSARWFGAAIFLAVTTCYLFLPLLLSPRRFQYLRHVSTLQNVFVANTLSLTCSCLCVALFLFVFRGSWNLPLFFVF